MSFGGSKGVLAKEDIEEDDSEGVYVLLCVEALGLSVDFWREEGIGLSWTMHIALVSLYISFVSVGTVCFSEVNDLNPVLSVNHDVIR